MAAAKKKSQDARIAAMIVWFVRNVRAGMTLPEDAVFHLDLRTGSLEYTDRKTYIAQSERCAVDGCPCKWLATCLASPPPAGFLHVFFENEQGFIASLLEDPRMKKTATVPFPMYRPSGAKQTDAN